MMNPEDFMEMRVELRYLREAVQDIKRAIEVNSKQITELQAAANMGKGAWFALVKLGVVIVGLITATSGIGIAVTSFFTHK